MIYALQNDVHGDGHSVHDRARDVHDGARGMLQLDWHDHESIQCDDDRESARQIAQVECEEKYHQVIHLYKYDN